MAKIGDTFKLDCLRTPTHASDIWWLRLETCSNLFTWELSSNQCWHLVATETHTVGKRSVHILLECFSCLDCFFHISLIFITFHWPLSFTWKFWYNQWTGPYMSRYATNIDCSIEYFQEFFNEGQNNRTWLPLLLDVGENRKVLIFYLSMKRAYLIHKARDVNCTDRSRKTKGSRSFVADLSTFHCSTYGISFRISWFGQCLL